MFSRGSICSCCRGRRPAEGSQAIVGRTAPPLVKRRPRAFQSHGSNTFGRKRLQHAASLADPTVQCRRALSQAAKHEFAGIFLGFVNTKSCAAVSLRATAWQLPELLSAYLDPLESSLHFASVPLCICIGEPYSHTQIAAASSLHCGTLQHLHHTFSFSSLLTLGHLHHNVAFSFLSLSLSLLIIFHSKRKKNKKRERQRRRLTE